MDTETDKTKKITKRNLPSEVKAAVKAGQAKKAEELCVLDLREAALIHGFFHHHAREFLAAECRHL